MKYVIFGLLTCCFALHAETIWIEGENAQSHTMNRHPWWYDQVKKEAFSGADFLSNFSEEKPAEAQYQITVKTAGEHEFWIHGNPIQSTMSVSWNGGEFTAVDVKSEVREQTNVAADDKPDLRFIAWIHAGKVTLKVGKNSVRFRMAGKPQNHGYIDCFVLSNEKFVPKGLLQPQQMAAAQAQEEAANKGWFAFVPPSEAAGQSPINLRHLNEQQAGDGGFIAAADGHFIQSRTKQPLRFWAVNGPPAELTGPALRDAARLLAIQGVNLVRVHGAMCDENGSVDPRKIEHAMEVVRVMKAEGIYTHFSIYFPLWLKPRSDHPWLQGYDGNSHPFAAIYFHPRFQQEYHSWWKILLTTPDKVTGKTLSEDPAVMGVELVNEDSLFFWTFDSKNIPPPQRAMIEKRFGDWLIKRHGSLEKALKNWGDRKIENDDLAEGRIGFRPLWAMCQERTLRDQETIEFLYQLQSSFYQQSYDSLRSLGFKGMITASNWATADPTLLGPLEKLSYMSGDFIDRHGYFAGVHHGENSEWSLREGHTYSERSALRFDPQEPGKEKSFNHPVMDPEYGDKPSMISETTFTRPNRYRTEAPLFFAAYGALQDTDAIVHFAFDGARWAVKPNFWMQPWTLASPAMMGQFPATALIYRKNLIAPGALVTAINLPPKDLFALKGTPLPQDASLDELRSKELPLAAAAWKPGARLDPLLHFVGRSRVTFSEKSIAPQLHDLSSYIQRDARILTSSHRQLKLDYGKGILTVNAPAAQGVCGDLAAAGKVETADATFTSSLDLGCVLLVALDDKPLSTSQRMMLQVMSEEKPTDFTTIAAGTGLKKITNLGRDPWLVKELQGTIQLKRADAASLQLYSIGPDGKKQKHLGPAQSITLEKTTLHYLIEKP